jgi:hypothetical protein
VKNPRILMLAAAVLLAAPAFAAEAEKPALVFGTYYRCNQATEERADDIFKDTLAPLLKQEVAAGRLTAFGWSKHWLGGEWRRLEYMIGTDMDAMVDARKSYIDKLNAGELKKAGDEFSALCPSHDDYIWSTAAGSQPATAVGRTRPAVGMTTYFQCDSREDEADAIVKTAFAPIMNQHVKDGKIASWIWLRHIMGGKYRRALVVDGADHKSMLKYWASLTQALDAQQPELSRSFGQICSSHSDYVWDLSAN